MPRVLAEFYLQHDAMWVVRTAQPRSKFFHHVDACLPRDTLLVVSAGGAQDPPLKPVKQLAPVSQLFPRIHGVLVYTADTALEGHIEQVAVDDGVPVRGLQKPRLNRLKNVLPKPRVADVQVLQR